MSVRHSKSQREDARQKALIEKRQKDADLDEAYPIIPAIFLSYLAALKMEADQPTRQVRELGTRVTGSSDDDTGPPIPRSNRAAAKEIERLQAWMYREGNRGMGTYAKEDAEGHVGKIEGIVYPTRTAERLVHGGKHSSSTPLQRMA
jgi:hypothetical protein